MKAFFPIFGEQFSSENWIPIDLSENNPQLDYLKTAVPEYLDGFVRSHFDEKHKVAFGGYGEKRATYLSAAHFSEMPEEEIRCFHLGIDLWATSGTSVYAPLDGIVHSFRFNDLPFDYGPTIILKHQLDGNECFVLYGHLSLDSLEGVEVGMEIKRGDRIGKIGDSDVNGGWSPHLHLQIMHDMFEWVGDFPGATSEKDKARFFSNSPDPSFLINPN